MRALKDAALAAETAPAAAAAAAPHNGNGNGNGTAHDESDTPILAAR